MRKETQRVNRGTKGLEEELKLAHMLSRRRERVRIKRVDHVGIVVKNIYEALSIFDKLFEFVKLVRIDILQEQGVKVAIIPIGELEVELIEPIDPGTGIAKFLEKRGEGLHHIAFEVDDANEGLKSLGEKGAKLIDRESWQGLRGRTGFIHPASTKGVLIELIQRA